MLGNIQLNNWFDGEIVTVTDMKIVTQAMVQMALSTSGGNPMAMGIVPSFNGTTLSTTAGFVNFGETSDTAYINNTGTNLLVCYVPPKINIIPIATDCYIYVKPLISYAGDNRTTTVSAIVYTSTSAVDTGIKLCRLKNGYLINFVTSNLGSLTAINDIYQAGDFKYSMQTNDHVCGFGMWLACNGQSFDPNQYPELYAQIGTMFGTTSGTGGGKDTFPLTTANATAVNGGITSYLFTATANNAQLTTATYQANFSVNKITPQIKFNPYLFSIDSGSTTSTLLLTGASGQLANGGKLLLDIASTTSEYTIMSLTETPLAGSIAYKITGGTDTGYTYALNGVHLPTLASMTISSNVATATSNNASAQSWDYVASNNVTGITPTMKMTLAPITIDPTSTIGNLKLQSNISGLLVNGDKLIYDTGSAIAETTGITVSETPASVFDSSWGQLDFCSANNVLFAFGKSNRKLAYSLDRGITWLYSATIGGTGTANLQNVAFFNSTYYLSLMYNTNQGTINLYSSSDLINWNVADSQTFTNAGSVGVATNGIILSVAYSHRGGSGGGDTIRIRSSNDGVIFINSTTLTSINTDTFIVDYTCNNSQFLLSAWSYGSKSINGTTWDTNIATNTQPITHLFYHNNIYFACVYGGGAAGGIKTSTNWSTWTQPLSLGNGSSCNLVVNSSNYIALKYNTNNYYTSVDGISWNTHTQAGALFDGSATTLNDNGYIGKTSTQEMWVYNTLETSWTSTNLATSGYLYTITSPSLPVAIPTKVYKGGQGLQYSVQASSISAFSTPTSPTFTRAADSVTKTYATVTGLSGTHVQLKAINYNTGDILTSLEGALITVGGSGSLYTITTLPTMSNVPIWAAKGGQQLQYSVSLNTTPNYNVAPIGGYIRAVDNITAMATQISGTSGQYVNIRAANINNTETINYIGAEVQDNANVHYTYEVTGNTRSNTTIGVLPLLPNASGKGLSVYNANHPVGSSYGADSYSVPLVGHTHTAGFIGVAHTHAGSIALDPHTHGVQDPGHSHQYDMPYFKLSADGGGTSYYTATQPRNTTTNLTGISILPTTINGTATIQSATAGGSVTVNPVGTAGATMSVIQPTLYVKNLFIFAK